MMKFVFAHNDDGSYYISNWHHFAQKSHERFLQVSNGGPALAQAKSKCRLYRNKYNDTYVYVIDICHQSLGVHLRYAAHSIAISDSDSRDPRAIVFDPPSANVGEKLVCCSTTTLVS